MKRTAIAILIDLKMQQTATFAYFSRFKAPLNPVGNPYCGQGIQQFIPAGIGNSWKRNCRADFKHLLAVLDCHSER